MVWLLDMVVVVVVVVLGVVCGAAASGNYHWANPLNVSHILSPPIPPTKVYSPPPSSAATPPAAAAWIAFLDYLPTTALTHTPYPSSPPPPPPPPLYQLDGPDAVPLSLGLEDFAKAVACMLLAGPLLTGYTQTINDWYDREIDAINEPYRPIPSGRISEGQVIAQIWVLLLSGEEDL